jgi:2-amino-4-hydroxy-6-hydroxymethyldihydropteridine diphosphokinase
MAKALLGLGGNLGDVRETLERAIDQLCADDAMRLLARSADYRTPPWGRTDQPAFVNCCIAVETTLSPRALLQRALATERAFGRDRASGERWGPRTLDVDILAYEGVALREPDLILPHPRLLERAFVLIPLAEIRPEFTVNGIRIADALTHVDRAGIERLPPRA